MRLRSIFVVLLAGKHGLQEILLHISAAKIIWVAYSRKQLAIDCWLLYTERVFLAQIFLRAIAVISLLRLLLHLSLHFPDFVKDEDTKADGWDESRARDVYWEKDSPGYGTWIVPPIVLQPDYQQEEIQVDLY